MVRTKNRLSKKVLAVILAFACVVAFTPMMAFPQNANAATKLKVSPASKTIYVGKTVKIKAKGLSKSKLKKVKWTTSSTSKATVSKKKGSYTVVKGKSVGKVTITAKYGKKKIKAKITVDSTVGTPVITGEAVVGKTLTAAASGTGTYQWYKTAANGNITKIAGATGSTYTLTAADAGYTFYVTDKGTGYYTGTKTSAKTDTVVGDVAITGAALDSAAATVGQTLNVTTTPAAATVTYQWYAGDTAIVGETGNSYTVTGDYVGKTIKCTVTGTGAYTGTKTTTATAAVTATPVTAVAITIADGTIATVGNELTAATTPANADCTYQWYRDGYAIDGATSKTYTPAAADLGKALKVEVTGRNGYTGTATDTKTVGTDIAKAATITVTKTATSATAAVAKTDTDKTPLTINSDYTTAWYLDNVSDATKLYTNSGHTTPAAGASIDFGTSYYLSNGNSATLVGHKLICVATGVASTYGGKLTSDATSTITDTISGVTYSITTPANIKVGSEITATLATDNNAAAKDITAAYQWYRGTTAIAGATTAKYTPTAADLGKTLTCRVTGTGNFTGTIDTAMAGPVVQCTALAVNIATNGGSTTSQVVGTALVATVAPAENVTYQWTSCATESGDYTNITGATSSTYTPTAAGYYKCAVTVVTDNRDAYNPYIATSGAIREGTALTGVTLGGNATTANNAFTATVAPAAAVSHVTYSWYLDNTAANNQIGTVTEGTWAASATATLDLTSTSLATQNKDVISTFRGHKVICVVEGKDAYAGTVSAASANITTALGAATVDNYQVGKKATVTSTGADYAAGDFTVQWYLDGNKISGATTNEYTPTAADYGKTLSAIITGTGNWTGTVTTSGSAITQQAATAVKNIINPVAGTDALGLIFTPAGAANYVTYTWTVGGSQVSTAATFTPTAAQAESGITCTIAAKAGSPYSFDNLTYTWAAGDFQ